MALHARSLFRKILLAALALLAAWAMPRPARADAQTQPWNAPTALASGLPNAAHPSLAFTPDGAEHVVWESGGEIQYTYRMPNGAWSTAHRIAYGAAPSLAVSRDGRLHLVFAKELFGNYEIYHIFRENGAWSMPVNISHTTGLSADPVLAAAGNGLLYAAWTDFAPGYSTIYYAVWNGEYWVNRPVDNARGQAPALTISKDGSIYLAWQDRVPAPDDPTGKYDIFLSQLGGSGWSLPVNISDDAQFDAIGAHLATTPNGLAHIVWIDGDQKVFYCYGRDFYWPLPQAVVHAEVIARSPQIAIARGDHMHIAWDEGDIVRTVVAAPMTGVWPRPDALMPQTGDLREVALAATPDGGATIVWIQALQPGAVAVYESARGIGFIPHSWIPGIIR